MIIKNTSRLNDNIPILFFDGGSRGNPGKAAGASVILMPDGSKHTVSKYLKFATNNEAEYTGLIVGLEKAQELGIKELEIQGDSNLVINQVKGSWKVKSENLRDLYNQARQLFYSFSATNIKWIPREENKLADAAANICMDKKESHGILEQSKINNDLSSPETVVKPELNKDNKANLSMVYAKGDIILINNIYPPENPQQGTIIEEPKQLKNGKWLLTIEVEENNL